MKNLCEELHKNKRKKNHGKIIESIEIRNEYVTKFICIECKSFSNAILPAGKKKPGMCNSTMYEHNPLK